MDRNRRHEDGSLRLDTVALRKESVDRNGGGLSACARGCRSLSARRAWIEIAWQWPPEDPHPSLSARRAWIEIERNACCANAGCVALRKESVDRNTPRTVTPSRIFAVALRKESVDRNTGAKTFIPRMGRRSPQGERG